MGNKEKVFISAVVYIHNSEKVLGDFLKMIIDVMETNFENSEIICVNDCSDDGSVSVIRKIAETAVSSSITILNMSYFHGLELAMNAGVDLSIGDFVFEFDTVRSSFDGSVVMDVYKKALEGFDIVSASPVKKEKITSRLFYKVFDKFSAGNFHMTTESFRILSRRVINRISSMNRTVVYRKVVYAGSGLKTANIRFDDSERIDSETDNTEKRYRISLAVDSLILFTELGYRFSITMTAVMMAVAACMIIYSVTAYFVIHPIEGWTTTVLFLSVAFFGLFGILTIIVKYLQIIVNLIFKRRRYNYESVEKLTD